MDVDIDNVSNFAFENGLSIDDSYDNVLSNPEIDAVILVTPHLLHEKQVIAAAKSGKQIFCEKPFALNKTAAKRMLAACEKNNIIVGIGHERRFEPALEAMKDYYDMGKFGTLIHIECNWSHNNFTKNVASGWRKDPEQAPAGTPVSYTHLTLPTNRQV